jgi:NagD protein
MSERKQIECWLTDMDGVLVHEGRPVPGAREFLARLTGPSAEGSLPATGAVAALITKATNVTPYFVGKPNPLMMRSALNTVGGHSETTAMIGDRMDTDVVSGMEAGLYTILVLTGVTQPNDVDRFPFKPSRIAASIADLVDMVD